MIRVVVFDFDGTLVNSNAVKETCMHKTVAGIPGGKAALEAARRDGGDRYRVFLAMARHLAPNADVWAQATQARELTRAYSDCCSSGITAAAERRGARQALAGLVRRGLRVWILSATPKEHLVPLLRQRGLSRWLRGSLGSSVTKENGLRRIMAAERAGRNQVLLVGDGPDDRAAATAAGVRFVGITAEGRVEAKGRFAMRDLRSLVPLIDSIRGKRLTR